MQLIDNTTDLQSLCRRLSKQQFVCVDLEFLREHTYFAKLCLVQIAAIDESAIIDPLASDIDLSSFFDLIQNQNVTKVFHSGRQDIEIIYNLSGKIPSPLYDTQIAAQAAGYGESVSYESLVSQILHIELDKSSRLSDWSRRPLSQNQLSYALSDVTHLVNLYSNLTAWLQDNNREHWIDEDLKALADEALYQIDPYTVWQKIKHRSHSPFFLTVLRELAAWREQRAITKNVPRHSFIKDDLLLNICAVCPDTKQTLSSIRGMRQDIASGKIGDEIIAVIQKAKNIAPTDYVIPPAEKESLCADTALMELLRLLLKTVAQEQKLTPKMIAHDDDLRKFCLYQQNIPFLQGWRYDIFGIKAEKLRNGNTAVSYDQQLHTLNFIDLSKQD